jgi:hypothetical protein
MLLIGFAGIGFMAYRRRNIAPARGLPPQPPIRAAKETAFGRSFFVWQFTAGAEW